MRRIETLEDVAAGLDALCAADPRLVAVRARSGDVPLRLGRPGFESLVSIVVSQQVSRASADAILGRLVALADPLSPETLVAAPEALYRAAGLSRPKERTLRALAFSILEDGFDLELICRLDADEALARMTALHGIGPWTAQVYLLFAAGHPDIFPSRDVALQAAIGHALDIAPRPSVRELDAIAESWAPWRGVAARLFWAYYRQWKGREGAPEGADAALADTELT